MEKRGLQAQMIKNKNEFISVNELLIKEYGPMIAIFLTKLINMDSQKDYFECSTEIIRKALGFTNKQQNYMLNKLISFDFLDIKPRGMPAKRYFKINYENLPDCIKARSPTKKTNEIITLQEKTKSEKPKTKTDRLKDEFEQLWQQYPNKQGKQKAFIAYEKAIKSGVTFATVMQGIQNYNFFIVQTGLEQQFVKHGSTWFNQRGWEDDYTVIEREPKPRDSLHERNKKVLLNWLEQSESDKDDKKTDVNELFGGVI